MTMLRRELLKTLDALSRAYPAMRLGQLIVNLSNAATQRPDACYDVEDEQLLKAARTLLTRRRAAGHSKGQANGRRQNTLPKLARRGA